MCGIVGIWRFNNVTISQEEIMDFNNTLSHRGPDGSGIYLDEQNTLALGHRRLSVIDLSDAGKQPMASQEGNLIITFNGEIYNFLELRDDLQKKGHVFKSRSDTEVILAAYQEWGESCVSKFNGMWAFAIWNPKKKSLFLSRDRFGVKPLYFVHIPGKFFAFASESIAFEKLLFFKKEMDTINLSITLLNVFALESEGKTIYKHIQKLKPGHNLTLEHNGKANFSQWWDTSSNLIQIPETYEETVSEFRRLLIEACKLRLRSDVSIGIALSGGLDSSSIFGIIKHIEREDPTNLRNLPDNWQTAFVACFPGTSMDEKQYADSVLKFTHGNVNYIYPDESRIADEIITQVRMEDFIYLSPPVVHTIYREMRKSGVTVSIDGHGADEMLFGYAHMIFEWAQQERNELILQDLKDTWIQMLGINEEQSIKSFHRDSDSKKSYLRQLYESLVPSPLKEVYRKFQHGKTRDKKYIKKYIKSPTRLASIPFSQKPYFSIPYSEFHSYSLPTLLRNWDRASMQHGIEIRMPFMDWRLVSYAFSLPPQFKVKNGYSKSILRESVKGMIPDDIRLRKNKIGINAPTIEWFNGPLNTFLLDIVSSQSFLNSEVWNGPLLRNIIERLCHDKAWSQSSSFELWPFINAWLLLEK